MSISDSDSVDTAVERLAGANEEEEVYPMRPINGKCNFSVYLSIITIIAALCGSRIFETDVKRYASHFGLIGHYCCSLAFESSIYLVDLCLTIIVVGYSLL